MGIYVGDKRYALYVGSTRRKVAEKEPLPYDSEVEYLGSSGTQYIDTGIVPKFPDVLRYVADVSYNDTTTRQIMGRQGYFYFGVVNGKLQPALGGTNTVDVSVSANTFHTIDVTFTSTTNGSNGTTAYSMDGTSGSLSSQFSDQPAGGSVWLFAANNATTLRGSNKLKSFKIYQGGILVRDFTPVRIGTTGYMYDKVSRVIFGNAGTGDFILGNDKN